MSMSRGSLGIVSCGITANRHWEELCKNPCLLPSSLIPKKASETLDREFCAFLCRQLPPMLVLFEAEKNSF